MKIGIIGFCNLNIMQYLYKYTKILDEQRIDYDVIYWNRLGIKEKINFQGVPIAYELPVDTYQEFYKKIGLFIKYAVFMRKKINSQRYDRLIILTTQTAIPLYDLLQNKYCEKYIYDFRDITKEKKNELYRKAVQRLVKKSFCTMMSSEGFIKEIGISNKKKIQIVHNTQTFCKSSCHAAIKKEIPINIMFWGIIRQLEYNKKVCDCFGNDKRYILTYHGTGCYDKLKNYCEEKGYVNIFFTGFYEQTDISGFAKNADILHCMYANDNEQKPAMPVKAYDAVKYRLPVLINKDSQVEKFFSSISGALGVNIEDPNITDYIYEWYVHLNCEDVEVDYKILEDQILKDDIAFNKRLREFIQ